MMHKRLLPGLVLLCLVAAPWPVRAADEKKLPAVVVRLKSIDGLIDDFRFLAEMADKGDVAKQVDEFIKGVTGKDGLLGIDTKKPIALYGHPGENVVDGEVVLMVPIADEKAFLDALKTYEIKTDKDKDGLYTASGERVDQIKQPVFFRFANSYVYITISDKKNVAKDRLRLPAEVMPAGKVTTLSAVVSIDRIPERLREIVLGQAELQLGNAKEEKDPGETEAQHQLKIAALDESAAQFKSLLADGQDLTLSFDIDRKTQDLSLTATLTSKSGSKLATSITDVGKSKSIGAALLTNDAALNFLFHALPSEQFQKAFGPVVDAFFKQTLADEQDKTKRALTNKFFKLIEPTLKKGEVDVAGSLRGPNTSGLFAGVGVLKVKDGLALEKAIKDLLKDAPEEDKKEITLDFDKVKDVNIHKVNPGKDYSEEAKAKFGNNPVFVAFRDDAVFVSLGEGALGAIKDAISADPKTTKMVEFDLSMARFAKLLGADQEDTIAAAKKAFAKTKNSDKLTITLEGGKELKFHAGMKAQFVTFFTLINEAQQKKAGK